MESSLRIRSRGAAGAKPRPTQRGRFRQNQSIEWLVWWQLGYEQSVYGLIWLYMTLKVAISSFFGAFRVYDKSPKESGHIAVITKGP